MGEYCSRGDTMEKKREEKPGENWEVKDPKPPVVQSGKLETKR